MQFARERIADLMRAYRECIARSDRISMPEIYERIVNMPTSRFWVSEIRAALVVAAAMRGEPCLEGMWPLKREMYQEIMARCHRLRLQHPELSIAQSCALVVQQPAPKFYLTPGSAKMMICKARRTWKVERLKR